MISIHQDKNVSKRISRLTYIIPSAVSVVRVLIALVVVLGFGDRREELLVGAIVWVPLVFTLDAVDGVLARKLKSQSLIGSFLDILADRAVEFIFLRHFVQVDLVPLWFVVPFYVRILITDACRALAFGMEKVSATGIFLPSQLRPLVLSKVSRTAYGALKGVLFGVLLLSQYYGPGALSSLTMVVMSGVLAFSLLRASPILVTYLPRVPDLMGPKLRAYTHPSVRDVAPRSTKVVSCLQLASDLGLAAWLVFTGWR